MTSVCWFLAGSPVPASFCLAGGGALSTSSFPSFDVAQPMLPVTWRQGVQKANRRDLQAYGRHSSKGDGAGDAAAAADALLFAFGFAAHRLPCADEKRHRRRLVVIVVLSSSFPGRPITGHTHDGSYFIGTAVSYLSRVLSSEMV